MKKLENKVAVITGGSTGIGLATAKRFVEEGAYVFITGRRQAELDKAVIEIGSNVTAVQGDIANFDDLDRLYTLIAGQKGKLDIVVANAAFVGVVATADVTPGHFDETFNTNARGTFFTIHKALPYMNDGGSIVVVSSGLHQKGVPVYPTYSASKAASRSYVRTWASDPSLIARNIRANAVSPGPVETPIIDLQFGTGEMGDIMRKQLISMVPMGRMGRPEEVASAILFLASNESSFITGIDIPVDGGATQV